MCQHAEGESNWLVYAERQRKLRQIELDGTNDFTRGIPFSAHPHAAKIRENAEPGGFYSDEWFRKNYYYKHDIIAWERGWKKAKAEHLEMYDV